MQHLTDERCDCTHCQLIDIMIGDPLLNAWEADFVKSLASYGWRQDYTPKQKLILQRIFQKQRKRYNR